MPKHSTEPPDLWVIQPILALFCDLIQLSQLVNNGGTSLTPQTEIDSATEDDTDSPTEDDTEDETEERKRRLNLGSRAEPSKRKKIN